ncbi:Rpn family recombination-promoting nuclease/putative transposase [Candidatus Merdisoma sp. JLR.KK006]|uniref:Rpn family recombination-promoting nuclease/putative transposase n=1 Tax=Candidatus Merdisoma sp. JLR.KK006 TaxID=3112626 RepID=UPI002FF0D625
MGASHTNWEDLGISNDFLFGKVMQNPRLCQELLQRILPDLKIDHIEYPELQKAIKPDADAKSIRLDVYVRDNKNIVYNIEMQASDTRELPKRSRYYQSLIDLQLIDKGQTYRTLNRSFIIFICLEDAFGHGRHIYTFENLCKEDSSISMGDETAKIFLNADSDKDDVSKELKAFLDYAAGKATNDTFVQELDEAVKEAKQNREWRHEYMTLLMRDQINVEKGVEKGEDRLSQLIARLMEDKRSQDVIRVTQDKLYRNKLYEEYFID